MKTPVAALDILAAPREQVLGLGERAAARQEEVVGAAAPLPFRRRLADPLARAQEIAILGHEIPEARPAGDEHIVRETNLPGALLFAAHEQALLDQAIDHGGPGRIGGDLVATHRARGGPVLPGTHGDQRAQYARKRCLRVRRQGVAHLVRVACHRTP